MAVVREEINHHTMKLMVGLIALLLAGLTSTLSGGQIDAISDAYHVGGWARDVFIGSLSAIAAFLFSYNGFSRGEMWLSKLAALAAVGIALFPSPYPDFDEIVPHVHYISAAVMFISLAVFCLYFRRRARDKGHRQALWRSHIYEACALVIGACVGLLALHFMVDGFFTRRIPRFVFAAEAVALSAFALSWLTASLALPVITRPEERQRVLAAATSEPTASQVGE